MNKKSLAVAFVLAAAAAAALPGLALAQPTGSIVAWGASEGTPPAGDDFIAVAAGPGHGLALREDGSIAAWGLNLVGQCDVPEPNTGFIAIAAGGRPAEGSSGWGHSLGLKADGSVVAWGNNWSGQCDVPAPNSDFVAIAAGYDHSLALRADGSVIVWGDSSPPPQPNTGFVAITTGGYRSYALRADGSVVAWGGGADACLPAVPNSGFVAIAASMMHELGLRGDGSIVGGERWWFHNCKDLQVPEPNSGFVAIAAGGDIDEFLWSFSHSLALRSNGSIVAWGNNFAGECNVPEPNTGFIAIAAAPAFSVALRAAGTPCAADWNQDGAVDSQDISSFIAAWISSVQHGTLDADLNFDGQVNSTDISAFITAWLAAVQSGGC